MAAKGTRSNFLSGDSLAAFWLVNNQPLTACRYR
jgi:hypothetical protein